MNKIIWFRFDLRIQDNEAFINATRNKSVLPLFIYDKNYFLSDTSSSFHLKFLKDSVEELTSELKKKFNANLNIYYGDTLDILNKLVDKYKIKEVFSNKVFNNRYLRDLDFKCEKKLKEKNVKWLKYNQFGVQINHRDRLNWSKNWNNFINNPIFPQNTSCKFISDDFKKNFNIKTNYIDDSYVQKGGRQEAILLLESFLSDRSENYQKEMSSPITGENSCSRLSPHITYGNISLKEIFKKTTDKLKTNINYNHKKSLIAFKSRLAWHCHFIQKLADEPEIEYQNLNRAFDGLRENSFNENYYIAWKNGNTGFPFVDACMRYLKKNGWINFRMRAMLVSFASYQLWLDWKKTSKYMAKLFTDYEPGIHYSQFQMQSGTTGINSIRIYNPIKQSIDQDPEGNFIRKWVPELKNIQGKLIHEPWNLTYIDEKSLGIEIGKDYPSPIVDNKKTSIFARDKIWSIKKSKNAKFLSTKILSKHVSLSSRR